MGSLFGGGCQLLVTGCLDRLNLILDQAKSRHVPPELGQRVRWRRLIIGCTQAFKALGGLVQGRSEAADAPRTRRRSMAGTIPATSQVDWLISTTATSVLF